MFTSIIKNLATGKTAPAMVVRIGIVGLNFTVMAGLAAWLGLEVLGQLIVIWGLSMIGSSIVSCGAPLMLLRALSDGGRITGFTMMLYVLIAPLLVGLVGFALLPAVLPALPWPAIIAAALAIHLATCLASIMRVLGSLHWSMILRDAAPQFALGFAAILAAGDSIAILAQSALLLFTICLIVTVWCVLQTGIGALLRKGATEPVPLSLWGTSVLGTALAQVDIVIGGAFLSDSQIGLYGLLRRLANLVVMPVSVATWVSSVPIAQAYGTGDRAALGRASRQASQVAIVPGAVLLGAGLVALAVMQMPVFQMWEAEGNWVCLILLGGAGLQLVFAATFTVATLCKLAHFAVLARLCSMVVYLVGVGLIPMMTPVSNAIVYSVALTAGNLLLWVVVQRRLGVDTSAWVLRRRREEVRWNPS